MTFAPGKNDGRFGGPWARDLDKDLDAIAAWGAKAVVTLLEPQELRWLAIARLGAEVERRGMEWAAHADPRRQHAGRRPSKPNGRRSAVGSAPGSTPARTFSSIVAAASAGRG